jgi:monoamine oxidase
VTSVEVAIIGAGAAGLAAARRLMAAHVSVMVLEARGRIGGRAFTESHDGLSLDHGCGWLHSADKNEWTRLAEQLGFTIDRSVPPWLNRQVLGMAPDEIAAYRAASNAFFERIDSASEEGPDRPASELLEPGNRWNGLLNALTTWISGAELEKLSLRDWARYADTEINWRVTEGYGALIAKYGAQAPVTLHCPVTTIDYRGHDIRLETPGGTLSAERVVIAVPSAIIGEERLHFLPGMPDKVQAALDLPLGLANKAFLRLAEPDRFPPESRAYGGVPGSKIGSYHFRPFGRPVIEAYLGGDLAEQLEPEGAAAAFAIDQLVELFGNDMRRQLSPIFATAWRTDPFARGSYSYARPGKAGARTILARPIQNRLFFAGEATSKRDFSTAHGAYRTGIAAAEQIIRLRAQ